MGQPIAIKELGLDPVEQLQKRLEIFEININSDLEQVRVNYREVLISPTGNPLKTTFEGVYVRYNSRKGDPALGYQKSVTKDNLKFDLLRASQVGQLIAGMIGLDIANYTGPESLEQIIYTEPIKEN